jgi:RNA polymerase I-specific transcription initiation factor RRN7
MQFPPLNAPALFYRLIRRLALPVDIYPATKTLQTLLGFTLEYPSRAAGKRKHLDMPELQLATLVVIATKLLFPFDGLQRHPTSTQEPAAQAINWKGWAESQQRFDKRDAEAGRIGKGKEIFVIDQDVWAMNTKQLDEYMDWYESSWLDTSKEPGPLDSLFPLSSATRASRPGTPTEEDNVEDAIDTMLKKTSQSLESRPVIGDADEDIPRPGSYNARYRTKSELPHLARVFYETAAKVTGVPLETLVHCVNQVEVQILKRWHEQRRIEHFAKQSMVELEGSDVDEDMDDSEG